MNKPENRQLERVQYWQGQTLRSSDFQDIQRIEAQRRWWHNRALHDAYGVYQGMQASEVDKSGTMLITVTPGIAYDCFGRELVLACSASVSLPLVSSPRDQVLTLLVRYRELDARKETDHRSVVCCLADGPSCASTVEFVWAADPWTSPADGVLLGRLPYRKRRPLRFRPFVAVPPQRPLARPKLGSGTTVPGNTSW